LKKLFSKLSKKLNTLKKFDADDFLLLGGVVAFFWGVWWIYHPAALIITGLGAIYLGMAKKKPE